MTRVIIDCDPGHDDAIALVLAHRHAQVLGISTVSGNAPLSETTANALMVTALLDVDTPVHAGAARPLVGEPRHAQIVHGASGLDGVERIEHRRTVESHNAVEFLLDAADKDVWIVAIGPLTNLALALERDPSWVRRIAGISIMGGSATIGNTTRVAEFNIFADPEAAARVFGAGAELRMCGLNLTHQLRTTDAIVSRLQSVGTARARFAAQVFDYMHLRMESLIGERESALHDPCAVLAVTHPELIEMQPRAVDVELEGTLTRGMTVVDQRSSRRQDPANASVAYRIDEHRAMDLVLECMA